MRGKNCAGMSFLAWSLRHFSYLGSFLLGASEGELCFVLGKLSDTVEWDMWDKVVFWNTI